MAQDFRRARAPKPTTFQGLKQSLEVRALTKTVLKSNRCSLPPRESRLSQDAERGEATPFAQGPGGPMKTKPSCWGALLTALAAT